MSQLRKYVADEAAIISLDDIQVDESMNYVEKPIVIIDRKTKTLRNKELRLVKVRWQHQKGFEWTWESEDEMRKHYPDLFASPNFKDKV